MQPSTAQGGKARLTPGPPVSQLIVTTPRTTGTSADGLFPNAGYVPPAVPCPAAGCSPTGRSPHLLLPPPCAPHLSALPPPARVLGPTPAPALRLIPTPTPVWVPATPQPLGPAWGWSREFANWLRDVQSSGRTAGVPPTWARSDFFGGGGFSWLQAAGIVRGISRYQILPKGVMSITCVSAGGDRSGDRA